MANNLIERKGLPGERRSYRIYRDGQPWSGASFVAPVADPTLNVFVFPEVILSGTHTGNFQDSFPSAVLPGFVSIVDTLDAIPGTPAWTDAGIGSTYYWDGANLTYADDDSFTAVTTAGGFIAQGVANMPKIVSTPQVDAVDGNISLTMNLTAAGAAQNITSVVWGAQWNQDGTTALDSPTVTGLSYTTAFQLGTQVTGTGIPDDTIVLAVVDDTTVTLSQSATAAGTVALLFVNPGVVRTDTGAAVVAAGGALPNTSTGVYADQFTPSTGINYNAWVTETNGSNTLRQQIPIAAFSIVPGAADTCAIKFVVINGASAPVGGVVCISARARAPPGNGLAEMGGDITVPSDDFGNVAQPLVQLAFFLLKVGVGPWTPLPVPAEDELDLGNIMGA